VIVAAPDEPGRPGGRRCAVAAASGPRAHRRSCYSDPVPVRAELPLRGRRALQE